MTMDPATLKEWATIVGVICGALLGVVTVWRQIVGPFIAQRRAEFAAAWEGFWRVVQWVERETGNGQDPPELAGKATRSILIQHYIETTPLIAEHKRLVRELAEHQAHHAGGGQVP